MADDARRAAPIKATDTSLRVLETLKSIGSAGVSEIAAEMNLPVSTVHDHLRTLETNHYVVAEDDRYRLGARLLTLGGLARERTKLFEVAKSEVETLANDTGEHANLMAEEHGMGIFLHIATGSQAISLDTYEGMRVYLHTTALGKAILASLSEERIDRILDRHGLPRFTEETITSREALSEELERIRERGYATDDNERIDGVRCVAAPVVDGSGEVLGAVSVSAPASRMRDDAFNDDLPRRVRRAANVIGVDATHS
jgi:DNA-binding IclR family transcriptional regulator